MATLDLSKIKPIPGFDCVAMKREIQAKIYEETKGMSREEEREYIRKGAERFDEKQRLRREERAKLAESVNS
jgi:hypothetical protein